MEAVHDLIVFDWVLALGSTQAAATLLDMPQSSVSRRYRSLAHQFSIPVRRHRGSLFISGEAHAYRMLRELCQHLRFLKHSYRWSWQPELRPMLEHVGHISEGGRLLSLDGDLWDQRQRYLEERILDACFEVCSEPDVDWIGVVDLGLHLHIPSGHPLAAGNLSERLSQSRRFPVHSGGLQLPAALLEELESDGFRLQSEADDPEALQLRPGRDLPGVIPLPHRLEAGWRVGPLPPLVTFNPMVLEMGVSGLSQAA